MADQPEIWKNEGRGPVGVRKMDARNPGSTKVELVRAGNQVILSTEERKITEEMIRKPVDNPFRNGHLIPIQIAEDAEDVKAIMSDPNTISGTEISKLFEGTLKSMEAKLAKISSPTALRRILDAANETGATTRRIEAIRDRLTAVGAVDAPEGPVTLGATPSGRDPWYPADQGGTAPDGGAQAKVG